MVQFCVVFGCKMEGYPGCGLTFHRLPTNDSLKEKWLEALNLSPNTSKNAVVCGLHFQDEDYLTQAKKRLKHDVIPSIVCKLTAPWTKQRLSVDSVSSSSSGSPSIAEETSTGGGSPPSQYFHHANEGSQCSLCHDLIKGPRMVCVQCPTCLCLACSAASPHDHHYMLHVPAGKDQEEVDVLLHKLRDLVHIPPASQGTEHTETDATSIFVEPLPEAGAQQVEYIEESSGEEEDAVLSCTTTAAGSKIDIGVKQASLVRVQRTDVEDDIEDTTLNLKSKPSSALSKRKLVDDPQTPGHSRPKHSMIKFQPHDQLVPGDHSHTPVNCDTKHRSSMKQSLGTENRLGRICGKVVQLKNVTVIRDNISKFITVEKTSRNTGIQGTRRCINSKQNSGKDGGLR